MQAAFLEDAQPGAVSHAVRDVLEREGALVTEHVSSRVRFRSLPTGSRWSWNRSGYVGIYQRAGEKEVELRLVLRARWPHRLFWWTALVDLLVAIGAFVFNPPGTTWFVLAFVTGLALVVTGLLYLNTWRSVRAQERALMLGFEEELRKDRVGAALVTLEERSLAEAEAALEGEVERVRLDRERRRAPKEPKPEKVKAPKEAAARGGLKLSFGRRKEKPEEPAAPASDETLEQKRARLLARRAELEREQQEGEGKP